MHAVDMLEGNPYLVVIIKINPSSKTLDGLPPFSCVTHDNGSALFVVLADTKFHDGLLARDTQLLVNLVFDGKAMRIPAEAAFDMVALH